MSEANRWERQKAQAEREGFKSAWAMQKAQKQKRNVWKLDKSLCGKYVEHASSEPATPLLDRLQGGSGPARTIPVEEWQPRQPAQPGPDTRHLAEVWK